MINRDLKMQYSKNFEVGLDFDMFGVKGGITYYNEKMRNGYTLRMVPQVLSFREYETYKGTEVPVYMDDPNNPGQPVLGVGGEPLDYRDEKIFHTASVKKPANDGKYDKWGVEYTFDFGQIRPVRTSVVVNGAYMTMTRKDSEGVLLYDTYSSVKVPIDGKNIYNPFLGAYYGGKSVSSGSVYTRFNSNINLITHIPKLRLITTLTVQCVWLNRTRNLRQTVFTSSMTTIIPFMAIFEWDEWQDDLPGSRFLYEHGWSAIAVQSGLVQRSYLWSGLPGIPSDGQCDYDLCRKFVQALFHGQPPCYERDRQDCPDFILRQQLYELAS